MPRFSDNNNRSKGPGRSLPSNLYTHSRFQKKNNNNVATHSANALQQRQQHAQPDEKCRKSEYENLDFDYSSNMEHDKTNSIHISDKTTKKRNTTSKSKAKGNVKSIPNNNYSSSSTTSREKKSNDCLATTKTTTTYDTVPFLNITIRRALAIDTRIQKTFECDVAGRSFQSNIYLFLQEIERRGVLPMYLSTIQYKKHAKHGYDLSAIEVLVHRLDSQCQQNKSQQGLNNVRMDDMEQKTWRENILPLYVQDNSSKNLSARESWKLFAEFVDKLTSEATNVADNAMQKQPQDHAPVNKSALNIILLTSDIALFSDSNPDSHKQGLDTFWSRIRKHFKNNHIRSVTIIIVSTADSMATLSWEPTSMQMSHDNNGREEGGCEAMNEGQSSFHQFQITKCLHKLHGHLTHLQQREYYNYDQKHREGRPIILELKSMDCNTIAMNELSRSWLRETMQNNNQYYGSLNFDLPETLDGCMCSIILELEYATLPYSITSSEGIGLMLDAYLLTLAASTKVKQVVPISSIDASLLYGVPMIAKAGRSSEYVASSNNEDEIIQYREMCTLVTQLLKWLDDNDCALLLHCSFTPFSSKLKNYNHVKIKNRFKSYSTHEHFFLLMAQHNAKDNRENNTNASYPSSTSGGYSNGVLFRYAMEEQLLFDMEENGKYSLLEEESIQADTHIAGEEATNEGDEDIVEAQKQYYDYIERSLDFLEKGGINPILMSMQARFSNSNTIDTNRDDDTENDNILDKESMNLGFENQENAETLPATKLDGNRDSATYNESNMNYFEGVDDEHFNHVFDQL